MSLGWPLGLAALAALLVPIVIHLARRRSGAPVLVGSLRHVPRASAPRRARARLSEPWLLAVRLAVLALLALFLAEPLLRGGSRGAGPRTLLVLPSGLDPDSLPGGIAPAADSLRRAGAEVLALGMNDLWSELAELDAELPAGTTLHVVAAERLRVAGARPRIRSRVVLHRFDDGGRRAPAAARAEAGSADSTGPEVLRVVIAADAAHATAAARVAAAFRAVAEHRGDSLDLSLDDAAVPRPDAWLVHLADTTVPSNHLDSIRAGATVIRSCCDPAAGDLAAQRIGDGLLLTAPVLDAPPLDASFPELIARIWPDPSRLSPTDVAERPISTAQLMPAEAGTSSQGIARPTALGRVVLLLAAALFLLERWLSHRRPAPAS